MRVLLVTSWDTNCGIAAHSEMLKESVERADPGIEIHPSAEALDADLVLREYLLPHGYTSDPPSEYLIHLNHHDALHSRWTPEHVRRIVIEHKIPVLVTYHDTRAGTPTAPNSDKLKAFCQVASSVVVHEPVEDCKAIYWRQGVPAPAQHPAHFGMGSVEVRMEGKGLLSLRPFKAYPQQPVLGTVGFDFPWKNFDRLCSLTREVGWAIVILSNNATPEREAHWRSLNPDSLIIREYLPTPTLVNYLAGCTATAFPYECQNNGTSGAIRLGIAALKPVIALQTCRQFRDLYLHDGGGDPAVVPSGIDWVSSWEEFRYMLRSTYPMTFHPRVSAFAHHDSWEKMGRDYSKLYRILTETGGPA